MSHSADQNLLFGIMALQMELIDRDQLIDALHGWAKAKDRPVGEILVDAGAIDQVTCRLLGELLAKRIARHDGNVEESLASYAAMQSSLKEALQAIDDVELTRTIARVPPPGYGQSAAEAETRVPGRFSIVRFHAKGGLGEVYVAEDRELHREVALKQIRSEYAHQLSNQGRFLAEAEITAGLSIPTSCQFTVSAEQMTDDRIMQ